MLAGTNTSFAKSGLSYCPLLNEKTERNAAVEFSLRSSKALEFVPSPPKTLMEVVGEKILAPLISSVFQPWANVPDKLTCEAALSEYRKTIKKIHTFQQLPMLKGEAKKAERILYQLKQEFDEKKQKSDLAHQRYVSPVNTGDNAKNRATSKGYHGNDLQIAIEASVEINSFSIVRTDPYSNLPTTKQSRNSKNRKEEHYERAIEYLVGVVFEENDQELNRLHAEISRQTRTTAAKVKTYQRQLKTLNISDEQIQEVISEETKHESFRNCPATAEELKNLFIDNENKIDVIFSNQKMDLHSKDGKHLRKSMLAAGIAKDICECYGITDNIIHEMIIQRIYGAMSDSDRRWYNDAMGVVYQLLTGTEPDDIAYESQGLKRAWNHINKPLKEFGNFVSQHSHNGGGATVGGSIDTNGGIYLHTSLSPNRYTVRPGKKTIPTPSSTISEPNNPQTTGEKKPDSSETINSQEKSKIRAKETIHIAIKEEQTNDPVSIHHISQLKNKPSISSSSPLKGPNLALQNVKNIFELIGEAQKKLIKYNSIRLIPNTIDFAEQIREHGFLKGSWNTFANSVVCVVGRRHPPVTILSHLYHDNVPEDKACQSNWEMYHEFRKYNLEGKGNIFTLLEEADLYLEAQECGAIDSMIRKPAQVENAVIKKITFN